jgi:hypothetical protein
VIQAHDGSHSVHYNNMVSGSYGHPSNPSIALSIHTTSCCKPSSCRILSQQPAGQLNAHPFRRASNSSDSGVAVTSLSKPTRRASGKLQRGGKMWRFALGDPCPPFFWFFVPHTIEPPRGSHERHEGSIIMWGTSKSILLRAMRESTSSGRRRGVGRTMAH